MHVVIKGTKTIAEYKERKAMMERLAADAFEEHKKAVTEWHHGEIEKVWFDHYGNICIEYEDGTYWHYNEKGEWF